MVSEALAEECGRATPDVDKIKELCMVQGIPSELRGKIWQILLGVHNKRANLEVPPGEGLTAEDQQTIKADVARTRQTVDKFKTDKAQADLEKLLTVYCKRRSVKYTQGLNELIAPFFLLDMDEGAIFNSFYGLMVKFLPNMLRGHDLLTLRRGLAMFGILLQYHCPDIHAHLTDCGVNPDLYATSWFVTLFAGDSTIPVVLALWDQLLLREDPFFVYFVALALLAGDKDNILGVGECDLHEYMRKIKMESPKDVEAAVAMAEELDKDTPRCFRRQLYRATLQNEANADVDEMLLTAPCIVVPATELSPDSASVRFFVIDCRPLDEYVRASLPTAVNLDLSAMSPEEVEKKVMSFKTGLAGQHLCIMGGDHSGPARVAVGILVAAKFGRISFMEQGFQACAELYEKGEMELVSESGAVDLSTEKGKPESGIGFRRQLLAGLSNLSSASGGSKDVDSGDAAIEVAERVKEEALKAKDRAKEAVIALQNDPRVQIAAEKTKEKAKEWGQRGIGFLSSALSKASKVAEDIKERTSNAGSAQRETGWTDIAGVASAEARFTIEDDEPESPGDKKKALRSEDGDDGEEFAADSPINVGHWMKKPDTEFFPCKRVLASGQTVQRYLVITATHLMDLESHKTKLNVAKLKAWNSILELDKVTFNKKDNEVVTFIFKNRDGGKPKGYIYVLKKESLTRAVEMIQANLKKLKKAQSQAKLGGQTAAAAKEGGGDLLGLSDGIAAVKISKGDAGMPQGDLIDVADPAPAPPAPAPAPAPASQPNLMDMDAVPPAQAASAAAAAAAAAAAGGGTTDLLGMLDTGAPQAAAAAPGGDLLGGLGNEADLLGGLESGVGQQGVGVAQAAAPAKVDGDVGGVLGLEEDELDWLNDVSIDGNADGGGGDDDDVPDWLKD